MLLKICKLLLKFWSDLAKFWLNKGTVELGPDDVHPGGGDGQGGAHVPRVNGRRPAPAFRAERYDSRATVSFESLNIRIPLKFCQNSVK